MKHNATIFALCALFSCLLLSACGKKTEKITIWSSGLDYQVEHYLTRLKEQFPDYTFTAEYMSSSEIPAKILEEGDSTTCDIVISEEYGYLAMMQDQLVELEGFDYSPFLDELVPANHKYTPEIKNGGCVIVNNTMLKEKGLPRPESYQDLLDPAYKGLISMPNPASSGTGYMFLRNLTNAWGEDEAFAWFEGLSQNILQFTSGGSGPVNAIVQGEVAIGLGMTSQAVLEKNGGVDLDILFFEEGSPYNIYGHAMVKRSVKRPEVRKVFDFIATELVKENNALFYPEQVFKDFIPEAEGFPTAITYGDMANDTFEEKERLLQRWAY